MAKKKAEPQKRRSAPVTRRREPRLTDGQVKIALANRLTVEELSEAVVEKQKRLRGSGPPATES